jgi:replicative DNA helicase
MLENQTPGPDLKKFPRQKTSSTIDRLPPSSVEAEQGVLGCMLLCPKECIGEAVEKLKGGPEMFYDLRHQTLFQTLVEMADEDTRVDMITLQQRLKNRKLLDGVGGLAYIASLPDQVPAAAGIDYYIDIVVEKYRLRKMIQTCASITSRIYEHEGEVDVIMDEAERDILNISGEDDGGGAQSIRVLVQGTIAQIEDYVSNKGKLTGIATGFVDFDIMTTGLHPGEMVVIAARPSVGKTSLAMNIADFTSVESKIPTGVFSLEMTKEQLVLRMMCSRARLDIRAIKDGFLKERDFPKLTGAAGKIAGSPLYIDDTGVLSILQLRAKARRMCQQYGIKLFVIDYLQLLHSTSRKADNRQQEIADISGGIKALSKELRVSIIVLSQLNREVEKRDGSPRLSDLRESGAIEQDADLVGLLYKDKEDDKEETNADDMAQPVTLYIAKQRNGPTGDVSLTFLKNYTRFESAARVSSEDIPPENQNRNYDKD